MMFFSQSTKQKAEAQYYDGINNESPKAVWLVNRLAEINANMMLKFVSRTNVVDKILQDFGDSARRQDKCIEF